VGSYIAILDSLSASGLFLIGRKGGKCSFRPSTTTPQMDKRLDAQFERRKSGSIMTTAPVAALPTTTTTAGSDKHGF